MKPLFDYEKVRRLAGRLLRNHRFQARRAALLGRDYLHAGCGPQIAPGFVNLDYRWVPGVDVVWDLSKPLPFPPGRFSGIFTEHCLEHFSPADLSRVLRDLLRVLQPGGRVRIVVPCLETHARLYLAGCTATNEAPASRINHVFYAGHDQRRGSGWSHDGHQFMHDHASLAAHLNAAGFGDIQREAFNQGSDPRLLIDNPSRAWESLYVEAVKPPAGTASCPT
jgi:predicted SAM-dependent methyltransferase